MGDKGSSDNERLFQLCTDFEQHVKEFRQHELAEREKFDKLIIAQQVNTDAIAELTRVVGKIVEDTSEIIQLHKDFQGAARVGKGFQGFMLWVLKWGAIGAGVYTVLNWIVEHFKS
jgi:hypothetical protein